MKEKIIYGFSSVIAFLFILGSCSDPEYSLGELKAPTNLVVTTEIVGQDAEHPNGDGSGEVKITVTGDNVLAYKIDYGTSSTLSLVPFDGEETKKYTATGVNEYVISVVAYGSGGASSNVTKEVTVRSDFNPDPKIITDLTGDASKTWVVDKSVPGHFGVGPWSSTSGWPEWYAAGVNEKEGCCNCFYTASFTFIKEDSGEFAMQVSTPDGAFTKTGDLTSLPGIPSSGDEGCYSYDGGTSDFSFAPSSTGIPGDNPSTQTSIMLSGESTFIGYGAVQKEYEILEITPDYLYLRVQGTETGNAWYLKLVPASAE